MMRCAAPIVAVGLLVGLTSTAYAQLNITYGYPAVNRGAQVIVRQPGLVQSGGVVAPGTYGDFSYTGATVVPGLPAGPMAPVAPYAAVPGYNAAVIAPSAASMSVYQAGMAGYVSPGAVIGATGYPSYPMNYSYGYGPGFRAGNPYASSMVYPYGRGMRTYGGGVVRWRGLR